MKRLLLSALLLTACNEYEVLTDLRKQVIDAQFTVEGVKVDVLFYADTSHSMERELYDLSKSIDGFTSRLDESATDWQMITVTGPSGCGNGGIISPTDSDWEERFASGIQEKPDEDDVDEWGLFNVFKATMSSAAGGCNDGFLRPDASLHVILLSDEADTSPGWQAGGEYWLDYVNPVLYIKEDTTKVRFSGVIGPVPNGCTGADPGEGYAQAIDYTDGEVLSICDEWIDELSLLADASVIQDFFYLEYVPLDGELILVEVNSEERAEGWAYDAEAQGIQFTADPPGAWDEVHVRYSAMVEVEVEEE